MINKLLVMALMLGVCWVGACDDSSPPPEKADAPDRNAAPAGDDSNSYRRPPAEDDPFAWAEDTAPLSEDEFTPVEPTADQPIATTADQPAPAVNQPEVPPAEPVEEEAPVPAEQPSASAEDDPFAWAEDTPDLTEEDLAVADQPADPAEEVAPPPDPPTPSVLGFTMTTIDGRAQPLSAYQGKVMLIVNTASRCGLTGQYEGLQALHTEFADDGLAVLGFPANNFQGQEPGSNQDIATFCRANYGVTFRMFAKISVAGPDRHALYNTLTAAHTEPTGPGPISWNFEKFLIARDGTVVARFAPQVPPRHATIVEAIQRELAR